MIFYDYLNNIKKNSNRIPHALIIETNNCCDFKFLINEYLKTIICQSGHPYCNSCDACNKINKTPYADLIYLNNDVEKVSKEHITSIKEMFSHKAIEKYNTKLYVIKGIEDCNKQSLNSLLKFLEEPKDGIYALFFTKNKNKIMPTITSRCNFISIDDKSVNLSLELIGDQSDVINFVFDDYSHYEAIKDDIEFSTLLDNAKKYSTIHTDEQEINFILYSSKLTKEQFPIFLKLLIYYCDLSRRIFIMDIYKNLSLNINIKNTCVLLANCIRGKIWEQ